MRNISNFKFNLIFVIIFLIIILLYQWRICNHIKEINKFYKIKSHSYRHDLARDSTGTLPFISGSNLVFISDYVYDRKVQNIEPVNQLKNGDILFVDIDYTNEFFNSIYPKIKTKFILITHNGDLSTDIKHMKYLNQDKILAWFGQNTGFKHPKHIAIPIGIENTYFFPSINKINYLRNYLFQFDYKSIPWENRKYLLYASHSPNTNLKHRSYLSDMFKSFENSLILTQKENYTMYLKHMSESKYVLCPKGNGIDTHRFYETILMGAIPIVEKSSLDELYSKTTSLIVNKYSDLNIEILKNPYKHIKNMNFSKDILFMEYWLNQIKQFKPELDVRKLTQY